MIHFLRQLLPTQAATRKPQPRTSRPRFRPAIERLDDRITPTLGFGTATAFTVGTRPYGVAVGDLNGDGRADIVAGMAQGGTLVAGFSGRNLSSLGSFFAGPGTGGVTLALADLNNDGKLDVITGAATGPAVVRAFSGRDLSSLGSFFVFGGAAVGVNVSGNDLNGDGRPDLLLGTASGASIVEGYNGINLAFLGSLMPFGALNGGVYVG